MAAAIVLIPEMLSGPDRETDAPKAVSLPTRGETGIKTYTIDLNQPPGSQAANKPLEDRAPPPEEVTTEVLPEAQVKPEAPQESPPTDVVVEDPPPASPTTTSVARNAASPTAAVVEPPTQAARSPTPEPAAPATKPLASPASVPTSGGWAVQLGSFSKEATAERLAKELRGQGHEAFVMPVKSAAATLYRVRIGPMKDRGSAEATLRTVKTSAPGAAIVAHP